jgi:transcriptional regulator with XRE-family HTH domain
MYMRRNTIDRPTSEDKNQGYTVGLMPKKVEASFPFGARLTAARLARGLTQTQLAHAIGSSQRAISAYETVLEFPPSHVLVQLAKALHVSADELLGLKVPKDRESAPELSAEAKRLWKLFQKVATLPEKDRRAVTRLVLSLTSLKTARAA